MLLLGYQWSAGTPVPPPVTGLVQTTGVGLYVDNPTGRPKSDIIRRAYALCGIADYEFGLTAEEVSIGLEILNMMMAEHPFSELGYYFSDYGDGLPEEPSGLQPWAFQTVAQWLAINLAPTIGKTLSREFQVAASRSQFMIQSRVAVIPSMPYQAGTIRGAGSKGRYGRGPFFPESVVSTSDDLSAGNLVEIAEGNG